MVWRMKSAPLWKVTGLALFVLAVAAAILFVERLPFFTVSDLRTPGPQVTASAQSLPAQIPALSLGTVSIQTFAGPISVRTGSGTVISSDGLILTTVTVVPYGSGSYAYQVATADGQLLRAKTVWRDRSGLVLLKVPATDLQTVSFDNDAPIQAGTDLSIVGAFVHLSRYIPVILPAKVPFLADTNDIPLSIDRTFWTMLAGARATDNAARAVGIVQLNGAYPRLVSAAIINESIKRYLDSVAKKN